MQAAELIESRSPQWRQLEEICAQLETGWRKRKLKAQRCAEFAALYRSACADLALADAYQLPAETVRYLHQLVGRAHNQLYRTQGASTSGWFERIFRTLPRQLFEDNFLRLAAALFWLPFFASMFLASIYSPISGYAEDVIDQDDLVQMEFSHSEPFEERGRIGYGSVGAGFYIHHNATIGLRCFVWGIAFGVGGMFETFFNAVYLGAVFGHMTTVPNNQYFFEFVTAHGPFELTAIVLSAAAGMKMGFSLVNTGGLKRTDALLSSARDALPMMFVGVALFVMAAFIEGYLSPTALPYEFKAFVGMISTLLLLGYFVGLGFSFQEDQLSGPQGQAPLKVGSPFDSPTPTAPDSPAPAP